MPHIRRDESFTAFGTTPKWTEFCWHLTSGCKGVNKANVKGRLIPTLRRDSSNRVNSVILSNLGATSTGFTAFTEAAWCLNTAKEPSRQDF